MSKIKEAKRSILQIMPADGWAAVLQDDDGVPPETVTGTSFCMGCRARNRRKEGVYAGDGPIY